MQVPKELLDKYPGFHLEVEMLNNVSKKYFVKFMKRLTNHHNYDKLKDAFFINEKEKTIIKIIDKIPNEEFEDLNNLERYYYPLCNKEEIKRIMHIQDAQDYLLKFTAEQILENIRLYKVFISLRKTTLEHWSLEKNYTGSYYKFYGYYSELPERERKICENVPIGLIHMSEANGHCVKSPYGNIIVISYALEHFLYYMNLFHYSNQYEFPFEDAFQSYLIGVRIMMGFESLDFELAPRGELPKEIEEVIKRRVHWQIQFIIGHEYAHHYLNHLNDAKLSLIKYSVNSSDAKTNLHIFNYSQQNELDADYNSIVKPLFLDDSDDRDEIANASFLFFILLDVYEATAHYMFPPGGSVPSHPNPLDRLWVLRNRLDKNIGMSEDQLLDFINFYKSFKEKILQDYLPFNIDYIETYGALYLPSFKKDFKFDHLDF
jgi:hypothetical protein